MNTVEGLCAVICRLSDAFSFSFSPCDVHCSYSVETVLIRYNNTYMNATSSAVYTCSVLDEARHTMGQAEIGLLSLFMV